MALSFEHQVEKINYPKFKNFDVHNLHLVSSILDQNALGDSPFRNNPILIPRIQQKEKLGVVIVLSGFAGNGTKYLGDKGFDETFMQQLDRIYHQKLAPYAAYVFVDAWTFWGGSQFINSKAVGRYEDYILKELLPCVFSIFNIDSKKTAIMGQSSGGYGALHLSSKYPDVFKYCGALAPDCFFEASLLPDLYKASPYLSKNSHYSSLKTLHQQRQILKQKNGFSIINAIAMTACYSPSTKGRSIDWPIDFKTGKLNLKTWKRWLDHDPLCFLPKRKRQLLKLKGLFLDVGNRDEFHLQMGLRQIHANLKKSRINHHYSEFDGGHFDAHERYPLFWEWLTKKWRTNS